MGPNASLLDLLLEAQALDRVPRAGYALRGVADPESVAEHSYQVALAVWTLAPRVAGLDAARAVAIALLHDLAEVRTGDLPRNAARYLPPGAKQAAERAAFAELAAPAGARAAALFEEYLAASTPEARFVRACDKLQLMVKVLVYERWGSGALAEFWDHPANFPDETEFPLFGELVAELRSRREALDRGSTRTVPAAAPR